MAETRDDIKDETDEGLRDRLRGFVDDADIGANAGRVARDFWPKLARVAARIPFAEDAVAAWFCAMDGQTPLRVRGLLFAALAYFVLPFDLIPDFLIGIGFGDDLTVIVSTVTLLAANIQPRHREAARRVLDGEEEMTEEGAVRAGERSGVRTDPEMRSRDAEEAEVMEPLRGGEGV